MLLILDLDETLIFGTERPLARPPDLRMPPYFVYGRPHLDRFLAYCFESFHVAVWSSASEDYVTGVVQRFFTRQEELVFVWSRGRCSCIYDAESGREYWLKNLRKVKRQGYPLEQVLMLDDDPDALRKNYGNHIPVMPFRGDPADDELPRLMRYLPTLADLPDVRTVEKRDWRG
ncbi:MAG: HAD family hydrolase [Kiritimatiellae bacterium]|nr:HAD family hydrolase [Kiritimatiellia bacterium]